MYQYLESHVEEHFGSLAESVELLDFHQMKLTEWKIEKGYINLRGWFLASFKLQEGDADAIQNGTGTISEETKGFYFAVTLGEDFKLAKNKDTQKELIEITLQAASA